MGVRTKVFQAQLPSHIPVQETERGVIVSPASAADVQAVLEIANMTRTLVSPDCGQQLGERGALLDMTALNRVIRHRAEEFLLTVETGISMGALADILEAAGQRLAHPYNRDRTLLSVLSEAPMSLAETRYAPLPHWVVGTRAVTGDAKPIHYGGEVVKNVTGYDLNRLFVGSRNRYGLMTECTLKTLPKPEMTRSFLFHVEDMRDALDLIHQIQRHVPEPDMLTLFKTKTTFGWQLLVTLAGYREQVMLQGEVIHDLVDGLNTALQELYLAPTAVEQWVHKLDWTHQEEPDALVLSVALPPKAMMDYPYRFFTQPWLKTADVLLPVRANRMLLRWISVNMPQPEQLERFKTQIADLGGFVELLRLPALLKLDAAEFNADPHPVTALWARRLKDQFDPNNVLPASLLCLPVPETGGVR